MSTTTADRLALLLRTKQWQRRELEKRYPSLDFDEIPFSAYRQLWMGRAYVPGLVGAWNAYGRSNSDADRDVLYDYSGHGRDIKLYNFDFTESSGYSGGGLVSDGIDDYGQCIKDFSLPDDYTVVAVRRYIGEWKRNGISLVSKGYNTGAFTFEGQTGTVNGFSYGGNNYLPASRIPAIFSYQTKTSYNGNALNVGTAVDDDTRPLVLFKSNPTSVSSVQAVLYDLRIYDHSLTDEELQLVKDDMMTDYEKNAKPLDGITYVADWDAKGRSNDEDADVRNKWVDKATGKVINLNNFAYAGMSGWGGCGTDMSKLVPHNDIAVTETTYMSLKCTRILKQSNSPISEWGPNQIASGPATVRFRITGVSDNLSIRFESYTLEEGLKTLFTATGDGVYTAEISDPAKYYRWIAVLPADAVYPVNCNVTIEQLPLYPGALVGDGIDDYGVTQEAINEEVGTR